MNSFFGRNPITGKSQIYTVSHSGHVLGTGVAPGNVLAEAARLRMAKMREEQLRMQALREHAALVRQMQQQQIQQQQEHARKTMEDMQNRLRERLRVARAAAEIQTQHKDPILQKPTQEKRAMNTPELSLYEQGRHFYYLRQFPEAEKIFLQLSGDKEHQSQASYGLGVLCYAQGKNTDAEKHFKECQLGSNDPGLRQDATYYLAQLALRRRDIPRSTELHREVLSQNAEHFGSAWQLDALERYTLDYARAQYRQRRFNASQKAFQELLKSTKYKAAGNYGLGIIAFQHGDTETAKKRFKDCLDLHPRHANAWYYLGRIAERAKQPKETVNEFYNKALEINPRHVGAAIQLKKAEKPTPSVHHNRTTPRAHSTDSSASKVRRR